MVLNCEYNNAILESNLSRGCLSFAAQEFLLFFLSMCEMIFLVFSTVQWSHVRRKTNVQPVF